MTNNEPASLPLTPFLLLLLLPAILSALLALPACPACAAPPRPSPYGYAPHAAWHAPWWTTHGHAPRGELLHNFQEKALTASSCVLSAAQLAEMCCSGVKLCVVDLQRAVQVACCHYVCCIACCLISACWALCAACHVAELWNVQLRQVL
jgi:hypothetical protein